jgi:hypothetical protein
MMLTATITNSKMTQRRMVREALTILELTWNHHQQWQHHQILKKFRAIFQLLTRTLIGLFFQLRELASNVSHMTIQHRAQPALIWPGCFKKSTCAVKLAASILATLS